MTLVCPFSELRQSLLARSLSEDCPVWHPALGTWIWNRPAECAETQLLLHPPQISSQHQGGGDIVGGGSALWALGKLSQNTWPWGMQRLDWHSTLLFLLWKERVGRVGATAPPASTPEQLRGYSGCDAVVANRCR
jgi:hypothetical protein